MVPDSDDYPNQIPQGPTLWIMDVGKIRTALAASATAIAAVGGAYGAWAILNAIMSADPLTRFLLAVGGLGAGGMVAYASARGMSQRV